MGLFFINKNSCWKINALNFDTTNDIPRCLSLVESLLDGRNAPIRRILNRRVKFNVLFQTYSFFFEVIARPTWSFLTKWFSASSLLAAATFISIISQGVLLSAGSNYTGFTLGLLIFSVAVSGYSRFEKMKFIHNNCDSHEHQPTLPKAHEVDYVILGRCNSLSVNIFCSFKSVIWIELGGVWNYPIATALESVTSAFTSIGKVQN